jgi:ABC-type antimicrobial peptide transport system permease subunit
MVFCFCTDAGVWSVVRLAGFNLVGVKFKDQPIRCQADTVNHCAQPVIAGLLLLPPEHIERFVLQIIQHQRTDEFIEVAGVDRFYIAVLVALFDRFLTGVAGIRSRGNVEPRVTSCF